MTVLLDIRRSGRLRVGRTRHGYWVPEAMRSKDRPTSSFVVQVCARCKLDKPHGKRPDNGKPRSVCSDCWAIQLREWREKNWQRVKLRDTYRGMIDRCHNPDRMRRWAAASGIAGAWRDYGAAGVKVCRRWRDPVNGFKNFCADMGMPPTKLHTLDRIRPSKNYSKTNCRWSTKDVQDANRKNSVPLPGKDPDTGQLIELTIGEWARRLNVTRSCLNMRLRRGWPLEAALSSRVDSSVPF